MGGPAQGSMGGSSSAPPRWPFLRSRALLAELGNFLAPGCVSERAGQEVGVQHRILWVTAPAGSGASTAIQVALQAVAQPSGGANARTPSSSSTSTPLPPLTAVLDCQASLEAAPEAPAGSPVRSSHSMAAGHSTAQILSAFELTLRMQVPEQATATSSESASKIAQYVLRRYPEAAQGIKSSATALGTRAGLPGAVARGTELAPQWKEANEKHGGDPVAFATAMANIVASVPGKQLLLKPPTPVAALFALLRDAGVRLDSTQGLSSMVPRSTMYLLAATKGAAEVEGRDIAVVLLRSELLGRSAQGHEFLEHLTKVTSETTGGKGKGSLRLILQSRDGVAACRAKEELNATVLTADEWPEEMARAVMQPRFLDAEETAVWSGLWDSVGGHPAHLKRVAELVHEEKMLMAKEMLEEQQQQQRQQLAAGMRPQMSQDAEEWAARSTAQKMEDSWRHDVKGVSETPSDRLMRRLPQAMQNEVQEFENQVKSFGEHPYLRIFLESAGGSAGALTSLARRVDELCKAGSAGVPVNGKIGDVQDPLLLALLDVGLASPRWDSEGKARVAVAPKLARSTLSAWVETLLAEQPLLSRLQCRLALWSSSSSSATSSSTAPSSS